MKRSDVPPMDKTAWYVLFHGGWRALVTLVLMVAPFYGWILFYYLSTGAWNQPVELVAGNAPLLATFFAPLVIAAWTIGFRQWYIVISAITAAIVAGWTPPASLAAQLLPYGYINLGIVLVLLMIGWRSFCYWRDHTVHKLSIDRYTHSAYVLIIFVAISPLALLLPITI